MWTAWIAAKHQKVRDPVTDRLSAIFAGCDRLPRRVANFRSSQSLRISFRPTSLIMVTRLLRAAVFILLLAHAASSDDGDTALAETPVVTGWTDYASTMTYRVADTISSFGRNTWQTMRDRPCFSSFLATIYGFEVKSQLASWRDKIADIPVKTMQSLPSMDQLSVLDVRQYMPQTETLQDWAAQLTEPTGRATSHLKNAFHRHIGSAFDNVRFGDMASSAVRFVDENPAQLIAGGAVIGSLIGLGMAYRDSWSVVVPPTEPTVDVATTPTEEVVIAADVAPITEVASKTEIINHVVNQDDDWKEKLFQFDSYLSYDWMTYVKIGVPCALAASTITVCFVMCCCRRRTSVCRKKKYGLYDY